MIPIWSLIRELFTHPILFAVIQILYLFFKIYVALWVAESWESLLPSFALQWIPSSWVMGVALFYFFLTTIWVMFMTWAAVRIQGSRGLSQRQKTTLFWERFANGNELKKSKPTAFFPKIVFYLRILIFAPWIWLTAIIRFARVGQFITDLSQEP